MNAHSSRSLLAGSLLLATSSAVWAQSVDVPQPAPAPPGADAPAASAADAALANPYAATVPVDDGSEPARQKALRNALQVVLTTVSGGMPADEAGLHGAESLLRYYGYVRDNVSGGLMLQAEFDRGAIDGRLRAAGLPIFGVVAGPASDMLISVEGIASSDDYATLMRYLDSMSSVHDVRVLQVGHGLVQLQLTVDGGDARFAGAASVGDVLQPLAPGHFAMVAQRR